MLLSTYLDHNNAFGTAFILFYTKNYVLFYIKDKNLLFIVRTFVLCFNF